VNCDQKKTSFQQGRVNNAQFELHAGCWAKQVLWELHDVFPSKAVSSKGEFSQ